jgi:hypothetical protein
MTFLQKVGSFRLVRGFAPSQPTINAQVTKPQSQDTRESFRQCLWYGVSRGATGSFQSDQSALAKRRSL